MISNIRELSLDDLTAVSGGGGLRLPVFAGVKQLGIGGKGHSGGGHTGGSVDPNPQLGSSYNGDSFDSDPQSGGYMGDGNSYRPF